MKLDRIKMVLLLIAMLLIAVIALNPLLSGVILGSAIVAFKAGIGCRYSSLDKKKVYFMALSYFLIAIILASMLEGIMSSLSDLLNYTVSLHLFIAFLLLIAGYVTIRKSACGIDLSNKTFLAIAIPCPVCFAAIFISCYFASLTLEISKLAIGAIVGAVIALGILFMSFQRKEDPEKLGKIMLVLGIYYFFAILLIPAVLQGMSFKYAITEFFSPYSLVLLIPIALGAIRGALRYA